MSLFLTEEDFAAAAARLGIEVAAIKAVAEVESKKSGFLPSGKVVILFERHLFSRLTDRKYDRDHAQISSRNPGGYYGGEEEYRRFNAAFALDPKAAMRSCSWGKFQILGNNHELCGFETIDAFVDAMKSGERAQLDAFCSFVEANQLTEHLRSLDWAKFAKKYNGPNYRKNYYDTRLHIAYKKYKNSESQPAASLTSAASETIRPLISASIPSPQGSPIDIKKETSMLTILDNWKTTIAGVALFLAEVLPDLAKILTDLSGFALEVGNAAANGDLISLLPLVKTFVALFGSIALVLARDWKKAQKELGGLQ